jgi:hypothetical protein
MKNDYNRLLRKMYIIEHLGETLYEALSSRANDPAEAEVYRTLAQNERDTRARIEKELASASLSCPILKARAASSLLRPLLYLTPLSFVKQRLHRILARRMFSTWKSEFGESNTEFWTTLVEHENLQHQMLDL